MKKFVLVAAAVAAVLGIAASGATGAASETGVTARTVTIGGTYPLSGPASLYATIPNAMKAYFSYVNARRGTDGKRGVYGRQIVFNVFDDGYSPAQAIQLTRQLVEKDQVFAVVGSLGTEVNLAVRPYLNSKKVPHLLVATGATTWGLEAERYPYTTGFQPPYQMEGRMYGEAIARNSPNAKVAVLYQNDDYGKDYVKGLEAGLGAKASNIVAKEAYEVTAPDVKSQVAKLRASGAEVLVILATPKFTIQTYAIANALKWSPPVIYTNSVSATDTFLGLAIKSGAGAVPYNTFTTQYAKDPANARWDSDEGMKLYKQVMATYYPSGRVTDALNLYGVAVAHAFVQLLYQAGKEPTRAALLEAAHKWTDANPFLLPGNKQVTSGTDQFPIQCMWLARYTTTGFQPVSALRCPAPPTS
ncbi:MAG: branched-chain amino acid ABC transporter substrate-binding protein [Thermoleophilia bacterium]|nr:branched-chain amino acid ABC transporter substrate-binding protein [Thermoleophilia bacterium]